jgi:predicted esterase
MFLFSLAALACVASCTRSDAPRKTDEPAPRVAAIVPLPEESPLGEKPIVEMEVPGYFASKVALPLRAQAKRPVIVATHGAWDSPHYYCDFWKKTVGDRAFVVCPRGKMASPKDTPVDQAAFFYGDHHQLGSEVTAALDSMRASWADRIDFERPLYTGFSQGAIQGAVMLPNHPAKFGYAILVEGGFGGYNEWGPGAAKQFVANGGRRIALLCGHDSCAQRAENVKRWIDAAGGEARVVHVEGVGHTHGGGMEPAVVQAFAWVTEGDQRWR